MPRHFRPPRSAFRPLKITATLVSPVLGDVALPLDSLLHFLVHREAYGRQDFTTPGSPTEVTGNGDTSLPFARVNEHGPDWFYAASFARWPEKYVDGGDHWSKRFPLQRADYLDTSRGSVDVSSGRYKGYRMPVFYRHAEHITWYALGQPKRIADLLPFLTHLGKKTAQGWGEIGQWNVEETQEDWSVRGPEGEVMRAIPDPSGLFTGFRPSYWYAKNQTRCLLPSLE